MGAGLVKSVKNKWDKEGCRHERNTVLHDCASEMSERSRSVRDWKVRAALWRKAWRNAGLPMGVPRSLTPVVVCGEGLDA